MLDEKRSTVPVKTCFGAWHVNVDFVIRRQDSYYLMAQVIDNLSRRRIYDSRL